MCSVQALSATVLLGWTGHPSLFTPRPTIERSQKRAEITVQQIDRSELAYSVSGRNFLFSGEEPHDEVSNSAQGPG